MSFFTSCLVELKLVPEFYILAVCVPLQQIYHPLTLKIKSTYVYVYAYGGIIEMKHL